MPAIGTKWTLVLLALGYVVLLPQIGRGGWIVAIPPVAFVFLLPRDLVLVDLPPGAKLHHYREGVMASVASSTRWTLSLSFVGSPISSYMLPMSVFLASSSGMLATTAARFLVNVCEYM